MEKKSIERREMKKIVITGPESSGKTTLATQLAGHFGCPLVPEYARVYLSQLDRPYREADLLHIARGQLEAEKQLAGEAALLICDTDLITLYIWSIYKYGRCDDWIVRQIEQRPYELYLLCRPDIPWVYDPLREHPAERASIYKLYEQSLQRLQNKYVPVWGTESERLNLAVSAIKALQDAGRG